MTDDTNKAMNEGRDAAEQRDPAVPMEILVRREHDSDTETTIFVRSATESEGASLLLALADIASKEIRVDGLVWNMDEEPIEEIPNIPSMGRWKSDSRLTPRFDLSHDSFDEEDEDMEDLELPPTDDRYYWNRIRAVSMDTPEDDEGIRASPDSYRKSIATIISPENSPVSRLRPARRKRGLRAAKRHRSESMDSLSSEKRTLPNSKHRGKAMKVILRKKFSWKNYPELEAFLVANREEYLRHSALNYTVQQKQYNNRLTERLLELAAQHGYVFDDEAFSFVTVRDRIRCYFKSYVQSAKKRGVIIGYAARKAGLLTEEDLEKSAGIAGRIVLPSSSS